jgi:hypothetical protein
MPDSGRTAQRASQEHVRALYCACVVQWQIHRSGKVWVLVFCRLLPVDRDWYGKFSLDRCV